MQASMHACTHRDLVSQKGRSLALAGCVSLLQHGAAALGCSPTQIVILPQTAVQVVPQRPCT